MGIRIVCSGSDDAAITVSRLSQIAHYLRGLEIDRVTVVVDHDAIPSDRLCEPFDKKAVFEPQAGNDATEKGPDGIVVWGEPPEWATAEGVVRLDDIDESLDHVTLIQFRSVLSRNTSRDTLASLDLMRALRSQLPQHKPLCVRMATEPVPGPDAYAAQITSDKYANQVEQSDFRTILVLSRPERYIASEKGAAERLPELALDPATTLVVPGWAYASLSADHPGIVGRTVAIPVTPSATVGTPLRKGFAVPTFDPAGPAVMLPLAESLSNTISLLMEAEPEGTDSEWHAALTSLDRRGADVAVLGRPSQSELLRRVQPVSHAYTASDPLPSYVIVSLNPDWLDEFGHHAHFDRMLATAVEAEGGRLISLTSRALVQQGPSQVPTFSRPTYGFEPGEERVVVGTFVEELRDSLLPIVSAFPEIPIRVVMYSAALPHQRALIRLAHEIENEQVTFFVNLMRAHNELLDISAETTPALEKLMLEVALGAGPSVGVHTMADSRELGDLIRTLFGEDLPRWPMIGVTPLPDTDTRFVPGDPPTICYPATQVVKGLDTFVQLAEAVAADDLEYPCSLLARDTGHQAEWTQRLAAAGVELVHGVLDDEEYSAFMDRADVIVLPYHSRPFQIQTSGAFADAVQLRRPVVATGATWAGALVEEHGIGATFDELDVPGFIAAIQAVLADYSAIQQRMSDFAPTWLAENSPGALTHAFREVESRAPTREPNAPEVEFLLSLHEITMNHARSLQEAQREAGEDRQYDLAEANAHIERLEARLAARDSEIERLNERILITRADRDSEIERLNERILITRADRDTRIAELREASNSRIADRDHTIESLRQRVSTQHQRVERILRDYERTKSNLQTRVETRDNTIAGLKQEIARVREKRDSDRQSFERRIQDLKEGMALRDQQLAALNRRLVLRIERRISRLFGK